MWVTDSESELDPWPQGLLCSGRQTPLSHKTFLPFPANTSLPRNDHRAETFSDRSHLVGDIILAPEACSLDICLEK